MKIGGYEQHQPLFLAPMEDVSDMPFRLLCKEFGADVVYTEFISSEALIRDVKRTAAKLRVHEREHPVAIQLYGSNHDALEQGAAMAQEAGADWVDLNCGCWVKKIACRGDCAGLLRDLDQLRACVEAMQRGTSLPVTVKARIGWDDQSIVVLELARMLEDMGVAALAVHGRTRCQGYRGEADWSWFPRIKEVSGIPLIGNGDITAPEHVARVFELGCDGVMIGRGAIHAPWIFQRAKHYLATGEVLPEPDLEARFAICIRHLREQAAHRGERRGVLSFRKNYAHYLKGVHNISHLRRDLMTLEEVAPIVDRLNAFMEDYRAGKEAACLSA